MKKTAILTFFIFIISCTPSEINVAYHKKDTPKYLNISSDIGNRVIVEPYLGLFEGKMNTNFFLTVPAKDVMTYYLSNYRWSRPLRVHLETIKLIFVRMNFQPYQITCHLKSKVNNQTVKTEIMVKDEVEDVWISTVITLAFKPVIEQCFEQHAEDIKNATDRDN